MVLSLAKIGVEHAEYFVLTAQAEHKARKAAGATRYYLADDAGGNAFGRGRWLAGGDLKVSVGGEIDRPALTRFLTGHDPGDGHQLGKKFKPGGFYVDRRGIRRRRRSVAAFDCTYSIPKSVSAAWAIADLRTRAHIEAAFSESVAAAVAWLQENAVASRRGAGGTEHVAVPNGAGVAQFVHTSSRAGDPQLHAHLLFMNRVKCEDGKWRTLDGRKLYDNLQAASLRAAAVLRTSLTMRLGWAWGVIDERLHADLAGMPAELLAGWSRRSRAVAKAAADLTEAFETAHSREPTPAERHMLWDEATLATRTAKGEPELDDPHERWSAEALSLGFEADDVITAVGLAKPPPRDRYDRTELRITDAHDPASRLSIEIARSVQAQAETSKVQLSDADIAAAAAAIIAPQPCLADQPGIADCDAAQIVDQAASAVAAALKAQMISTPDESPAASPDSNRWHSPGLIAAETAAVQWLRGGLAEPAGRAVNDLDIDGLSPDQVHAARLVLDAGTNGVAIVGPAGAGKTTTLHRIVDAVGAENVIALAPTAEASATLGRVINTRADTVARALVAGEPFPDGALCIIDEASQLATRDLAALLGLCAAQGARVVLVGDNSQQASISAGGIFETVTDKAAIPTAALTNLWRFKDHSEAAATAALRTGSVAALDYHREHDRISAGAEAHAAETAADWWQERRDRDTVISAPSMLTVHAINDEIASRRHALGETGSVAAHLDGGHIARIGELITTRRNKRRIVTSKGRWVRNGSRWVVTAATPSGTILASAADDPDETVELPAAYARRWVQLGYTISQTRAQSLTVDQALTLIDNATSLPAMYVGITRGARGNWLHVLTDRPSFDPDTPTEHDDPDKVIETVVARRRQRFTASRTPDADESPHISAALHLHAIATTPHDQPLPVPDEFEARTWLRPTAADASPEELTWHYEEQWQAGFDDWLAAFDDTDRLAETGYYDYADDLSEPGHHDAYEHDPYIGIEYDDLPAAARTAAAPDVTADHEPIYASSADPVPDEAYDTIAAEAYDTYDQHDHHDEPGDPPMPSMTRTAPHGTRRGVNIDVLHDELARVGLADYLHSHYGIAVGTRKPADTWIECPLHRPGTTTAAHIISGRGRQLFSCFRCGELGIDAIGLIEKLEHCSTGAAIRRLADDLGVIATSSYQPAARPQRPRIDLRPASTAADTLDHLDADQRRHASELLTQCDALDDAIPLHPAFTAAARHYEHARTAGDTAAAAVAASRLAALSDPSTAQRLLTNGIKPDTADSNGSIRAEIAGERLAHHAARIADLAALRIHGLTGSQQHSAAAGFAAAVHAWLHDPAAAPLSAHYTDGPPDRPVFADCNELVAAYLPYIATTTPGDPLPVPRRDAITSAVAARSGPADTHERPDTTQAGWDALKNAAKWYQDQLDADTPDGRRARDYLADRGINAQDCQRWSIGWAPDEWHALCDHIGDHQLATDVGLAKQNDNGHTWDFLRGRITFPIHDPAGRVAGFAGRILDPGPDSPKYMNLRNTAYNAKAEAVYGAHHAAHAIADSGNAVIVEGYTDVIACHRNGISNAVAACGVAAGEGHVAALNGLGATSLTACFDGDQAGTKAAARLVRNAAAQHTPARIAQLPPGQDPADLATDQLHAAIAAAQPAVIAAVNAAIEDHNPRDAAPTADRLAATLACHDLTDPATAAAARMALIAALGSHWHRAAPAPQRPSPDRGIDTDIGDGADPARTPISR